uniref:Uncharacterized protein n=1 Tax=viral metagenome TaxID=1070528 RepID=A0A6C0EXG5_9ZZZZ
MFDLIAKFTRIFLFVALFIVFIPGFFFQLPSSGSKLTVAAVHGVLYSLAFVILEIIFNLKRIYLCIKSLGMAST